MRISPRVCIGVFTSALVAGMAASASPAQAVCVGTTSTVGVCAEVKPGSLPTVGVGTIYKDCVYIKPTCTPVSVPGPVVTPGEGSVVVVYCRPGEMASC